jgi:hypothetical protein
VVIFIGLICKSVPFSSASFDCSGGYGNCLNYDLFMELAKFINQIGLFSGCLVCCDVIKRRLLRRLLRAIRALLIGVSFYRQDLHN